MPFVAKSKSTRERLWIGQFERPREQIAPDDIVCQFDDCAAPLFIRGGTVTVRPHFAHKPNSPCMTALDVHPESPEHLAGKATLAAWLTETLRAQGYTNIRIELEVPVYEARRVADVMVTFPGGMREAHEFQLAKLTERDLETRTAAYHDAGISAVWWIGEGSDADTSGNRAWLLRNVGECPLVRLGDAAVAEHRVR